MATATRDVLIARNPATGAKIGEVSLSPPDAVAQFVNRAREAQSRWDLAGWKVRRAVLRRWWQILARDADAWADLIRSEVGKPFSEALAGDVVATLDGIRWTIRHAGRVLAGTRYGPGSQRFLLVPTGHMVQRPFGVVGIIGTWNYPLFLNALPIAQALAAGNAVVWKPSELTPLSGWTLQKSLDEAGFPDGLVSAVFGGPEVGRALVEASIDKAMFTGGVTNGRRVIEALAARGIPAVAELSGFDPAIVLPDAPFEATVKALTWGIFLNAGQTCVGIKRIYVVGDPTRWAEALATAARALRIGDPANEDIDLGPLISNAARDRFEGFIRAAIDAGAKLITGGEPIEGVGSFHAPTVLTAYDAAPETRLAGVFGPVVIVRGLPDVASAIAAANASEYGLAASVWSKDTRAAKAIAARLDAGMVTVNDAVTPTMHASAPFGGTKASGYGRSHGPQGLLEFTQPKVVFSRRAGGFRPNLYPYGTGPVRFFLHAYMKLFRG